MSHYLNQYWLVYWCIHVSLRLNDLFAPHFPIYIFDIIWMGVMTYPTNATSAIRGHMLRANTGLEADLWKTGVSSEQLHSWLDEMRREPTRAKLEMDGATPSRPSWRSSNSTHCWNKLGCWSTNSSFQLSNIRTLISTCWPNLDKSFQYIVQLLTTR